MHPASAGYVHPFESTSTISLVQHGAEAPASRRPPVISKLIDEPALLQLGVLSGAPELEFGSVQAAIVLPHKQRIAVLDGHAGAVRYFDLMGSLVSSHGRHGRGPGEFLRPVLMLSSSDTLYVLESTGSISAFSVTSDSLRYMNRRQLGIEILDACILDGTLYVHGRLRGSRTVVHAIAIHGAIERSFGEVYATGNELLWRQLARGHIACLNDLGIILLAPISIPEVRAYSARTGELLWWSRIVGFRTIVIQEIQRGTIMRFPTTGHHVAMRLTSSTDQAFVLLQIGFLPYWLGQGSRPAPVVQTFLLTADGSDVQFLGQDRGMVHDWSSRYVLTEHREPFPKIEVHMLKDGFGAH
jgi:hypothetical protein